MIWKQSASLISSKKVTSLNTVFKLFSANGKPIPYHHSTGIVDSKAFDKSGTSRKTFDKIDLSIYSEFADHFGDVVLVSLEELEPGTVNARLYSDYSDVSMITFDLENGCSFNSYAQTLLRKNLSKIKTMLGV